MRDQYVTCTETLDFVEVEVEYMDDCGNIDTEVEQMDETEVEEYLAGFELEGCTVKTAEVWEMVAEITYCGTNWDNAYEVDRSEAERGDMLWERVA